MNTHGNNLHRENQALYRSNDLFFWFLAFLVSYSAADTLHQRGLILNPGDTQLPQRLLRFP